MSEDPPDTNIPEAPQFHGPPNEDDFKVAELQVPEGIVGEDRKKLVDTLAWTSFRAHSGERVTAAQHESLEETRYNEISGQMNRKAWSQKAEVALSHLPLAERRRGGANDAAIIVTDLKGFKPYNDTHGWGKGNAVIKHTGDVLQDLFRTEDGDIVGYLNGDEFVVLIPFNSYISDEEIEQRREEFGLQGEITPEMFEAVRKEFKQDRREAVEGGLDKRIGPRMTKEIEDGNIPGIKYYIAYYEPGMTVDELIDAGDPKDSVHGMGVRHIPSREEMPDRDAQEAQKKNAA